MGGYRQQLRPGHGGPRLVTMAWNTGREEARPCRDCGLVVTHQEFGVSSGAFHFSAAKHTAPCGLPCFGAGVSGPVYRSKEFHRKTSEKGSCPRCGEKAAT